MREARRTRPGAVLLLLAGLALVGCTGAPGPEPKARGAPASGVRTLRLVFERGGDDIGAPEDRALLEEIGDAIRAGGAGEVAGRAFGMGRAELTIRAEGADAPERIRALVAGTRPGVRFRIAEGPPP